MLRFLQTRSGLIPKLSLAYAATLALIRPVAGKVSDRHGEAFVIVPSLVIAVVALIVLSLSTGLLGVLVSAVLYGIGFGCGGEPREEDKKPAIYASSF
ncbi:hypothetical protein HPL003_03520 [Paenibacillus terrae HPL-003]|uniref:Major facilitator superfamily (MFS) profile domain-containing protein n=1 Tax=Paenibacillus terrae (strain HPL-003) TaxID=985665 RepID=G7VT67_PAETH|nr:hypothetical protein HPL003_03520 [Paenibacillus terrae HPL-003]